MSDHIGDTLISLVIVRNMLSSNRSVTVFGGPAHALRRWFAGFDIRPLPEVAELGSALAPFDLVIQMHGRQPFAHLAAVHPHVITLGDVECGDWPGGMAARFAAFCEREFDVVDARIDNGLTPPAALGHRRHFDRVLIHPEANADDKRWLPKRFLRLASALQSRGLQPVFVIAPHERDRWTCLQDNRFCAPQWDDLDALAAFVYESGWFIGNDSGIGHLASNLGVPTLSLFRRRQVAERWRPAWGTTAVVLPWQGVPSAFLKERFWRQTLTCGRVLAAFDRLRASS